MMLNEIVMSKCLPLRYTRLAVTISLMLCACQKKPALAPAADSLSAMEPPPMGATTYNDELKRELEILEGLLNNRLDQKSVVLVKNALMKGSIKDINSNPHSFESYLIKVLLTLPEIIHKAEFDETEKLWLTAKFYFLKRRFIEAATQMTAILKEQPNFIEARNLRARAIFFLGNPDLALSELNLIITQAGEKSEHGLDALYLTGAIVYESNDLDHKRLDIGIKAWSRYLAIADAPPELKQELKDGLVELNHRRAAPKMDLVANIDPFTPQQKYTADKNHLLKSFANEELLLALQLSEQYLKKAYDEDIATIKARILFKTGRIDEAKKLLTAIVDKNPSYAPGFHYQGMVFMLQGQPQDAVAMWKKTLEINRDYGKLHNLDQRIAVAEKMIEPTKISTH